jgi:hypothetical protein
VYFDDLYCIQPFNSPPEKKRFSGLSVAFAFIAAKMLFVAYFIKFSVLFLAFIFPAENL